MAGTQRGSAARTSGGVRPVTSERLEDHLRDRRLLVSRREDGVLLGEWQDMPFSIGLGGREDSVLQVRGRWPRLLPARAGAGLAQLINDWNRDRVLPKVYSVPEGDAVAVVAETNLGVRFGASDEQLTETITLALSVTAQFFAGLEASVPPAREES
ncbi:hypothetical protein Bcav_2441 [Beutenbergia cavernae DSM 12333]|uniref:Sensory transduction regulator n=1 Tax=Beutenbergia cavernae (strain ATCC BAA-8 / DSM 12333 / CCUG 43141 / JCM 11478 / NBRC 16432 / NCIMB 13614 / HKI 0122) TaxID=471853 RepID=C5BWM5_BEUC1|nr:YbjN domain-containing protein [Beutenbergia cavernae]ACQ80691.1 hypothetical protein Bcav_2441 [Beutenbergia cavernae DSM 12333]